MSCVRLPGNEPGDQSPGCGRLEVGAEDTSAGPSHASWTRLVLTTGQRRPWSLTRGDSPPATPEVWLTLRPSCVSAFTSGCTEHGVGLCHVLSSLGAVSFGPHGLRPLLTLTREQPGVTASPSRSVLH